MRDRTRADAECLPGAPCQGDENWLSHDPVWAKFKQHHHSPTAAFEALGCQLFERWCRQEYGEAIQALYFVDGRGGDGGVEAFSILTDGSVIGLQTKAFWDGVKAPQIRQVEGSINAAATRHPTLKRYIVCCPLDLSPSRGNGTGKSELDQWQAFEVRMKTAHPDLDLQYRGEKLILEWLQNPASESVSAFWFEKSVTRGHWRSIFQRTRTAWLDLRYVPDIHVTTSLDAEYEWFTNHPRAHARIEGQISRLERNLENKRQVIQAYKDQLNEPDPKLIASCVNLLEAIGKASDDLTSLRAATSSRYLPLLDRPYTIDDATYLSADYLCEALSEATPTASTYGSTHFRRKNIQSLLEDLGAASKLFEKQARLRRFLRVIGDAGVGKTQTVTKLLDDASREGIPVIAIPATAHDPSLPLSQLLANAADLPGWSATEIIAGLEAAVLYAWRENGPVQNGPRRAILAIDGLEEHGSPEQWQRRLEELMVICKEFPLVAPIVTARYEALSSHSRSNTNFQNIELRNYDVTENLPEVFSAYASHFNITVPDPETLAWALRTPLAIRTFSEVYRDRTIDASSDLATSLAELFNLKLIRLDEELRQKDPSWPANRRLSFRILTRLLPPFLRYGKCEYQQFAEIVWRCLRETGCETANACNLFESATRSHGLLEIHTLGTDLMEVDSIVVRPGFNALIDYLLADKVAKSVRSVLTTRRPDWWILTALRRKFERLDRILGHIGKPEIFPQAMEARWNACSLTVAILLKDGISVLKSGLWRPFVPQKSLESLHASAIRDLIPEKAALHTQWVSQLLVRDMVSCRMIVADLVYPSCRIPNAEFGARFFHSIFAGLEMASRDLLWSGPDFLPHRSGAIWEGDGSEIQDHLNLRSEDPADTAPSLVAWTAASVVRKRQKRATSELARWGTANPKGMADLLQKFHLINDPQILESIVIAAVGAALAIVEHGAADDLARAAYSVFFAGRHHHPHRSVVSRHAARVIVERAFRIGSNLEPHLLLASRPPYPPAAQRLEFDPEVLSGDGQALYRSPLSGDLDWYIAKRAIDPFFHQRSHTHASGSENCYADLAEEILQTAIAEEWQMSEEARNLIGQELETRIAIRNVLAGPTLFSHESNEDPQAEDSEDEEQYSPRSHEEIMELIPSIRGHSEPAPPPCFGLPADQMLLEYATELGHSKPLLPKHLGDGLIVKLVRDWGWNSEVFLGELNGGNPGEVLGADAAIFRHYTNRGSHGSRSPVASFAEKYVWCAVDVVTAYFCDRLPGEVEWGEPLAPITDQTNLGSSITDPLLGKPDDSERNYREHWHPSDILPEISTAVTVQPNRGIEWLENAAWPNPAEWLSEDETGGILLYGFLSSSDHLQGVDVAAWLSCVAIRRDQLGLLKRDIACGPAVAESRSVHDCSGEFGGGSYTPISIACWAPWARDDRDWQWRTLGDSGEPVEIKFYPLVTKAMWEGPDGEASAYSPSKILRDAGGILNCNGDSSLLNYINAQGDEIANYQDPPFDDLSRNRNEWLRFQRVILFEALAELDLVPVWGVRVYRELQPALRPGNVWFDQDADWLIFADESGPDLRFEAIRIMEKRVNT